MSFRSIAPLVLAVALAGCNGGSSVPNPSPLAAHKATVLVHFVWPTKKQSSAKRSVQYISPSTDHITIQNTQSDNAIALVDQTIHVPFGTVSVAIPAAAGWNYYSFKEWATASETGQELANATSQVYIFDTSMTHPLDVVLKLNPTNMGFQMTTDSARTVTSFGRFATPSAVLCVGAPTHVFLAPLDGMDNVVSGVGTPGLTLSPSSSTDTRVSVVRTPNTYLTPPYVGLIQYTLTANVTMAAGSGSLLRVQVLFDDGTAPQGLAMFEVSTTMTCP